MLHYLLSWSDPAARLFDITIRFTAPADGPRLLLPAWRPGRYLIQDYAANVREWSAGEHRIRKNGKSSWRVEARAGEDVTVRYRYYAGLLDAGSSFLDFDEAYVNGSNLFMLVEGLRDEEHRLTIAAPADWRIETQLPRDAVLSRPSTPLTTGSDGEGSQSDGVTFLARGYDHLIDSPFIAAERMTRHTFAESGATFHLIFRGDDGIDTEPYVEPLRAIARSQAELFGGLPFAEYRYLVHVGEKWHGVEHEDSCSIVAKRAQFLGAGPGDEGYDHFLSICSHELFHAWNVQRIVPARFKPYDYWTETPTRLLWAMEGLTSYYGDLTLVRSGIWSVARYLAHLRKTIETLESLPARHHLSLAQASFDSWLADAAHMHDFGNAWFSFYTKGEIVSLLLDLTIRRATGGGKSLDDVLLLLWEEYGTTGRGLEEDAVERAVARVWSGPSGLPPEAAPKGCSTPGEFFALYVHGTDPLPYTELFDAAGVAFASAPQDPEQASLGAKLKMQDGLLVVEAAIRGGAGMDAGLLPGDELVALDGTRTTGEAALATALRGLRRGESAELVVARGGVMKRLSLAARPDPRPAITLKIAEPSDLRRQWLRRDE